MQAQVGHWSHTEVPQSTAPNWPQHLLRIPTPSLHCETVPGLQQDWLWPGLQTGINAFLRGISKYFKCGFLSPYSNNGYSRKPKDICPICYFGKRLQPPSKIAPVRQLEGISPFIGWHQCWTSPKDNPKYMERKRELAVFLPVLACAIWALPSQGLPSTSQGVILQSKAKCPVFPLKIPLKFPPSCKNFIFQINYIITDETIPNQGFCLWLWALLPQQGMPGALWWRTTIGLG